MPIPTFSRRLACRVIAPLAVAVGALIGASCSSLRYYAHVAHGQLQLVAQRQSLDTVIAAPSTDATLSARLTLARDARRFATEHLDLPDNRSYTTYVDLKRPYVVWNVFAAPRFSVDPVLHCFPIAGCVPYRGYFDEGLANAEAASQRKASDDVYVAGVSAYSTLGWFADSILSTMLRWDDEELVGTIFHELAHQKIYVRNDTAFNESFATFVQEEGLREWRAARGLPARDDRGRSVNADFTRLALDLRERLRTLYATHLDDAAMQAAKQREIDGFRARYATWRDTHWPDDHRYDRFVAAPINNATLLPFGLYDQWVPAFTQLFAQSNRRWATFYSRAGALGRQDLTSRSAALQALSAAR